MPDERPQHVSSIHVWDDPDSKIQFLERTLHGKDWRTTIIYPDKDAGSIAKRAATKATLEQKGYIVKEDIDDCGHATLQVHHIGDGTNLFDLYKETGLAKGTMHVGGHPTLPFRYLVRGYQQTVDAVGDMLGDPARANGFIYAFAESFLAFSGHGNRENDPKLWKNRLQSLSGRLFIAQSLLYLTISRTNDELSLEALHKKVSAQQKQHGDLTAIHYDAEKDKEPQGIAHSLIGFVRKYPVQIGAFLNDLGMVAYFGHAHLERKWARSKMQSLGVNHPDYNSLKYYVDTGYKFDMGRSIVSMLAWSSLLVPSQKHEEKENEGILGKAWGKLREEPQIIAGVGTLTSSSLALMGANAKKNNIQKIGESIYLLGDFMLFFTKGSEYGGGKEQDLGKLGEKVAKYMHHLPIVLGPSTRLEFTRNIARYIVEKDLATRQKTPIPRAELDERVETLARGIKKYVEAHNPHLDQLAEAAGAIAGHFPVEMRSQVIEGIIASVKRSENVYATPEEIKTAVNDSVAIAISAKSVRQSKLVQMKDISKEVAALAFAIPGIDAAATASAIYDALLPFTRAHPSDQRTLDAAMTAKAAENLGIPLHEISGTARGGQASADHIR